MQTMDTSKVKIFCKWVPGHPVCKFRKGRAQI